MGAYWPNAHSSAAHGKARKLQPGVQRGSCTVSFGPLGSLLHRARSASRSKRLPGAVPARGRFPGSVDESETGSVNEKAAFRGGLFIWVLVGRTSTRLQRTEKFADCSHGVQSGSRHVALPILGSLLHRARSASRSKRLPGAVPARGRFPGSVDESETGSVNEKAAFRGGLFIGPELRAA